jgi:hypothetical protein
VNTENLDPEVQAILRDDSDPSTVEVTYTDGRTETMPAQAAEALPQAAPTYDEAFGPPVSAVPLQPSDDPLGWDAAGAQLGVEDAATRAQPGYQAPPSALALADRAAAQAEPGGKTSSATPTQPLHDPMSDVVAPGAPGGMAPAGSSESTSTSTTQTVEDPETMQARTDQAFDDRATAQRQRDLDAQAARQAELDRLTAGYDARQAELQRQQRQAQLEAEGHRKVIAAMEKTPIDEDGFWSDSPGRAAGAWIALALSGFIQGATRGQNPALAQMTQALNHAQDRWLQNQQRQRESVYNSRLRLLGDANQTRDTLKMQISGIIDKRILADAQRAGIPPVPGLETYRAAQAVDRAERQNAIGGRVASQAEQRSVQEFKAQAATGPVRRGDVVLQQLGVDPKEHAEAMKQDGLNLGGLVGGASRLETISQALEKIAAKNGGQLPSQETFSWSSFGLAAQAARNGWGTDEVSVKQLMEEAKLAFKQTINIKSVDSENEGKNFNAIMDSGEGQTTLDAIRTRAKIANENAISIANGVSQDPQAYLDFVRGRQLNNRGVPGAATAIEERDTGYRVPGTAAAPGAKPAEERAVEQTTGGGAGGPAPSAPLAPDSTATASARAGTYQRGRFRKQL